MKNAFDLIAGKNLHIKDFTIKSIREDVFAIARLINGGLNRGSLYKKTVRIVCKLSKEGITYRGNIPRECSNDVYRYIAPFPQHLKKRKESVSKMRKSLSVPFGDGVRVWLKFTQDFINGIMPTGEVIMLNGIYGKEIDPATWSVLKAQGASGAWFDCIISCDGISRMRIKEMLRGYGGLLENIKIKIFDITIKKPYMWRNMVIKNMVKSSDIFSDYPKRWRKIEKNTDYWMLSSICRAM